MFARRDFLKNALICVPAGAAALGALLAACAGEDDGVVESALSNCSTSDTCDTSGEINDSISSNHGHTVNLTQAEVNAGQAATVTLTLGNGHTHTVALTAEMIADIAAGKLLRVASSTDSGHSHCVSFNCTSGGGGGGYQRA